MSNPKGFQFGNTLANRHNHTAEGRITPEYYSWRNMLTRCRNKRHKDWLYYGARGIKVCKRWYIFDNFLEDMGKRPTGMTLDRLNSNKNYKKSNCRWATPAQQAANRRCCYKNNGKVGSQS